MSKVYVISDTHFGHKRIIEFEKDARPYATIEDHDRDLVARWNAMVTKKDTVWHLGDVFFGKDGHKVLGELNGYKKLVLGNHDHYPLAVYQAYFGKIHGAAEYDGCILTHVPVHPNQLTRYRLNIHGHMHSKRVLGEQRCKRCLGHGEFEDAELRDSSFRTCTCPACDGLGSEPDPRYACVSVEHTDLAPVLMSSVTQSDAAEKQSR